MHLGIHFVIVAFRLINNIEPVLASTALRISDFKGCSSTEFRLQTFFGISIKRCAEKCKSRPDCSLLNYHTSRKMCELLQRVGDKTIITQSRPCVKVLRSDIDKSLTCDAADVDCTDVACPVVNVTNADVKGNIQNVGAKAKVTCKPGYTMTTGSQTITCDQTGSWTNVSTCQADYTYNYADAISKSLLFFYAQRSGSLPSDNPISWRGDSALGDKGDNNEDLTGGWYDAGDMVKFNFPMASTVTLLGLGMYRWPQAYQSIGLTCAMLDTLKWPLDYFLKCWNNDPANPKYYAQVGDGVADHGFWGRPEDMTMARPAFSITENKPGSDVAAETAAAMAIGSMLFRSTDSAYADQLLTAALQLYDFADSYRAKYSDSIPEASAYYRSWSGYYDELMFAATILYNVTGNTAYIQKARQAHDDGKYDTDFEKAWALSWDDKRIAAQLFMYDITGEQKYRDLVDKFLDRYRGENVPSKVKQTPQGLAWRDTWGPLRYAGQRGNWLSRSPFQSPMVNDINQAHGTGVWRKKVGVTLPQYVRLSPNEYRHRLKALEEICYNRSTPQIQEFDPDEIDDRLRVEQNHAILYCNIAKVASTFWKRILTVMKSNKKYSSPFQLSLSQTELLSFGTLKGKLSQKQMVVFLKQAFSFMFVRDPYARLYSGYEDKIYHVNTIFWRAIGAKVVKLVRKNPSPESLKYGHDVTFSEFVKYILLSWETGKGINSHFSPMHAQCDPCIMPYNFLGKLETFHEDANYLINIWQTRFPKFEIKFDDFDKETAMDTGTGQIKLTFRVWDSIRNETGYPLYNLLLRTWSDLQIRGILSKGIPFPFTPSETLNTTVTDVVQELRKALDIPVNRTELRLQRSEALAQAYRTISLDTMERLRKFVLTDCELFGYDDRPQLLFDRSAVDPNEFLYMKGI